MGGALSGYIAKTFLDVHKVSLVQLNRYFRQPVIKSSFIEARLLADAVGDNTARLESYREIIENILGLSREDSLNQEVEIAARDAMPRASGARSGRRGAKAKAKKVAGNNEPPAASEGEPVG